MCAFVCVLVLISVSVCLGFPWTTNIVVAVAGREG